MLPPPQVAWAPHSRSGRSPNDCPETNTIEIIEKVQKIMSCNLSNLHDLLFQSRSYLCAIEQNEHNGALMATHQGLVCMNGQSLEYLANYSLTVISMLCNI